MMGPWGGEWGAGGSVGGQRGFQGCRAASPHPSSSEASRQSGRRSQRYSRATHSPLPQENSPAVQARGWGVTAAGEGAHGQGVTPKHPPTPVWPGVNTRQDVRASRVTGVGMWCSEPRCPKLLQSTPKPPQAPPKDPLGLTGSQAAELEAVGGGEVGGDGAASQQVPQDPPELRLVPVPLRAHVQLHEHVPVQLPGGQGVSTPK